MKIRFCRHSLMTLACLPMLATFALTGAPPALAATRPELVETFVGKPPATIWPGAGFRLRDTVANRGNAATMVEAVTRYYLSGNTTRDTVDKRLTGSRSVAAGLGAGEISAGSADITIPAGLPAGSYYLLACADDTHLISESHEGNNCRISASKVAVVRGPDLIETRVSDPPPSSRPGASFSVRDTLFNQGNIATRAASAARFFFSSDTEKDGADKLLTGLRQVTAGLAPRSDSTGTTMVTIPAGMPAGTFHLLACADNTDLAEINRWNNCTASTATVTIATGPDLIETAVTDPPDTSRTGANFLVRDTVYNQGNVATGVETITRYFFSTDTTRDLVDKRLIGSRGIPAGLDPLRNSTGTVNVTVPAGMPAGLYYLLACADSTDALVETVEGGNCTASANRVSVASGPDLLVTAVSNPPAYTRPGGSLWVREAVFNQGNAPTADAATTRYFLSTTATKDPLDKRLEGTRTIPAGLDPLRSSSGAVRVTVPATMPAGTFYLIACADNLNVIAETSDTNNCQASTTTVEVPAAPTITSFTATPDVVDVGTASTLTAIFAGGEATIDHGVGPVTSGSGIQITPAVTTTYTLRVVNPAGIERSSTTTVVVDSTSVTLNPSTSTLSINGRQAFNATVHGAANPAVTWRVIEPAGGVVTAQGVYTAPGTPGTYHVRATSVADPTAWEDAAVTVNPAGTVTLALNPAGGSLVVGGRQDLSASVGGTTNTAVTWSIVGTGGGTVTASGPSTATFTAPATPATCRVRATSVADPTVRATATFTVVSNKTIAIQPAGAILQPGADQEFTATITGLVDTRVQWTLVEGETAGSLDDANANPVHYTATDTVDTYHLMAASVADPSLTTTVAISVTNVVAVAVTPATLEIRTTDAGLFVAEVTGATDTSTTWSLAEGAGSGTVDLPSYYARFRPSLAAAGQTFHVVATSNEDPTKNSSSLVSVLAPPEVSAFAATNNPMSHPRVEHTATLLGDGEVLVAGGYDGNVYQSSAEIFDPETATFTETGAMAVGRRLHSAVALDETHVLVAGGESPEGALQSAEIWSNGTFTATGAMGSTRMLHQAVRLQDGRVLHVGGRSKFWGYDGGVTLSSAEVFTPGSNSFTSLPTAMGTPRHHFTATLLDNDKVLIVGGQNESSTHLASAEIFDPADNSFRYTAGSLYAGRTGHTATLLHDGRVLIVGGAVNWDRDPASAEIYDPASDSFTQVAASLNVGRRNHAACRQPDGTVLIIGGEADWTIFGTVEAFDPDLALFTFANTLLTPRHSAQAVCSETGNVLVVGGIDGQITGTAELAP